MALLNVTSSPPSTAIVDALVNRPVPLTHSTPFALKRPATPPVIWATTPSFHAAAWGKSSCGSETPTPSFVNVSRASCSACAVCTHALVGMQPTRRHVPPRAGSCSMQTTLPPSCAARIAAVYPAGPPPRTATSHSTLHPFVGCFSAIVLTSAPVGASGSPAPRRPARSRTVGRARSRPRCGGRRQG